MYGSGLALGNLAACTLRHAPTNCSIPLCSEQELPGADFVQYEPVLPNAAIARGLSYTGTKIQACGVWKKLHTGGFAPACNAAYQMPWRQVMLTNANPLAGHDVTVVALGGSVTCGNQASRTHWMMLREWRQSSFYPTIGAQHNIHNGCQQATTSAVYSVCLQEFILRQAMVKTIAGMGAWPEVADAG